MYKESWICDSCGDINHVDSDINAYRTPANSLPTDWQIIKYTPDLILEGPNGNKSSIQHSVLCNNCKTKLVKFVTHVTEEDIPF